MQFILNLNFKILTKHSKKWTYNFGTNDDWSDDCGRQIIKAIREIKFSLYRVHFWKGCRETVSDLASCLTSLVDSRNRK